MDFDLIAIGAGPAGLCLATHALATLYTREETPARILRQAMVGFGERFTPFKRAVAASLTGLH